MTPEHAGSGVLRGSPALAAGAKKMLLGHFKRLGEIGLIPVDGERFFVAGVTGSEREKLLLGALRVTKELDDLLRGIESQLMLVVPAAQAEGLTVTDVAETIGVTRQAATTMLEHVGYKRFRSTAETASWRRSIRQRTGHEVELPPDALVDSAAVERLLEAPERLRLINAHDAWMIAGPTPIERVAALLAAMRSVAELREVVALAEDRLVRVARSVGISIASIAESLDISRQSVAKRLAPKSDARVRAQG